jgi:uncharacterized membrane protein YbaN (DUF454 family)
LKRIGVLCVGWAFIALGIVGLFLPILQGVLFLLIGLVILSTEYVWAHHLLHKLRERFPKIAAHMDHARERVDRFMKRKSPKAGEA